MIFQILSVVLGLAFFIVPLWAYRRGLKDGLAINQGKSIEPIQNPVQAVTKHYEQKKGKGEEDKMMQGLTNIMSYDGNPQKVGEDDKK